MLATLRANCLVGDLYQTRKREHSNKYHGRKVRGAMRRVAMGPRLVVVGGGGGNFSKDFLEEVSRRNMTGKFPSWLSSNESD